MAKLVDKLPLPDKRKEIVGACAQLLDDEVRKKRGIGGMAAAWERGRLLVIGRTARRL